MGAVVLFILQAKHLSETILPNFLQGLSHFLFQFSKADLFSLGKLLLKVCYDDLLDLVQRFSAKLHCVASGLVLLIRVLYSISRRLLFCII